MTKSLLKNKTLDEAVAIFSSKWKLDIYGEGAIIPSYPAILKTEVNGKNVYFILFENHLFDKPWTVKLTKPKMEDPGSHFKDFQLLQLGGFDGKAKS